MIAIICGVAAIWLAQREPAERTPAVSYSEFYELVEQGAVESLTLRDSTAEGRLRGPQSIAGREITAFRTQLPQQRDETLLPLLRKKDVDIKVEESEGSSVWPVVLGFLPWILIIGFWLWISRQARTAMTGNNPLGKLVKSRAQRFNPESDVTVRFIDVAGLDSAKRELKEVVEFLRDPKPFQRLGVKVPRGVLLIGPPGTGKTLLARAVAGEAGVPFFSMSGSDFIEMFVGVGAARVRELFQECKKHEPAIVFIDEIDAVGRARGTGLGGGHDEREQTLNQLLNEMDGFRRNDRTIVLAATNRPDVLDAALLRPGRFDRQVVLDRPARLARLAILEVHTRDKPLADDVDLESVARTTAGFSGADLANLVNEAALRAARRDADRVAARDFFQAMDRVVLGDQREITLLEKERRRVAVHEAGHALMAYLEPESDKPERISIIPRGRSLGSTLQRPQEDRYVVSEDELKAKLRVLMGGYAAERVVLRTVSTGAEDDLRKATEIAQRMVASWGMSEDIGPVHHELQREHPFLGRRVADDSGVSDATTHAVEGETRSLLGDAMNKAIEVLRQHRDGLDALVEELLDQETISGKALSDLLQRTLGHPPPEESRESVRAVLHSSTG